MNAIPIETKLHVFGIRHHGPGSARSLRQALEALSPDCILIEGPPEAESLLAYALHAEMKPPVALLIYDPEKPQRAVYYPFAVFSPEWQAIQFGLSRQTPVRFMDLPQSIQMALAGTEKEQESPPQLSPRDPLSYLAQAAGYSDSERWWEHWVEHRHDGKDIFAAVLEAMTALRESALPSALQQLDAERESRREAFMRQTIRSAQKEGFQRIAVVCGAWHAPMLAKMPAAKDDAALLKGLPKQKVAATWIPWTYRRLAFASGYGAGIESPGWYDFLWKQPSRHRRHLATHWLVEVARLLRGEDLDASSASVIETVRLAESLAALRQRPLPGLPELNEAAQAVLCFGDSLPLRLIHDRLIVSERLGEIPDETPMVPLAQDLGREQKRLRLPPEASQRLLDLDLRKPNDLDRSQLLHRLTLLGIEWGQREHQRGLQKGTFHELWTLQWQPEFAVELVEAGVWGNTISAAAAAKVRHEADAAPDLPALTGFLDATLLADLPEAAAYLMARLQAVAALASDVGHLLGALPPLAQILRYGNVRQTDASMVAGVLDGLVARISIGLPGACGSLNDEAAEEMFEKIIACHSAINLLQNSDHSSTWHCVMKQLADSTTLHGLVSGRACRLLLEARQFDAGEAARRFSFALSAASAPVRAASWIDGFLRNSGLLLLHDESLWRVLDDWTTALIPGHFISVLPLLRRTLSTFQPAECRQLGIRVASGPRRQAVVPQSSQEFDEQRAHQVLPLLAQMLGLAYEVKS